MSAPSAPSIPEMFNQSIKILSKPSLQTFEEHENKGTLREALMYVALGQPSPDCSDCATASTD